MGYCILVRNPNDNTVMAIANEENSAVLEIALREQAEELTKELPLCRSWPHKIVKAPE